MKKEEILRKIAAQLVGIAIDDLSTAEQNIANILEEAKIVSLDNEEIEWA